MSMPTTDKSIKADQALVDNVNSGAIDNPIINASPIVNADLAGKPNPIVGGSIISGPDEQEYSPDQDYISAGCSAVVPPGARKIYMIMVMVTMIVGAAFVYGLFKLFDL